MENDRLERKIPEINLNRVTSLTMSKIERDSNVSFFKNRFTKVACAIVAAFLITTGGAAYVLQAEGIQNIISILTGISQSKVLTVGKTIANKDYQLKVHEIVTDSRLGYVVISVEALGEKSKEHFDSYQFRSTTIGSAYGLSELVHYREPYIKYYRIDLKGTSKLQQYIPNDGNLRFSLDGIDTPIEVSLSPTVDRIDMEISENTTSGFQFQFTKLHISELGLSFEAIDTDTTTQEYDYKIELLFNNGTKALLLLEKNRWLLEKGDLVESRTLNGNSDSNGIYADAFILFSEIVPLDTIKQVIVNDIPFHISKETAY